MIYIEKEDKNFIYIKCDICGKNGKIPHPQNTKFGQKIITNETEEFYEYKTKMFYCKHDDEFPNRVYKYNFNPHTPKCLTCQSPNVERISTSSKVGAVALTGVFAINKVGKTFKCNNCGYTW